MSSDTIPALFLGAIESFDKKAAFRHKRDGRYIDVSHRDVFERVRHATLALKALRVARGDRVALMSENRLEWVVADMAIVSSGCINVPLYATLPDAQVEYILRDSEARAIFVSSRVQLDKVLRVRDRAEMLQHIIVFDAGAASPGVIQLDDFIARGASLPQTDFREIVAPIAPSDWASILYTSGTTGDPKGVILSHSNFVSNVRACCAVLPFGADDTSLSFLPLSHAFERTAGYYAMMHAGTTIAYAESIDTIAENMREVHPTIVLAVPRLYEKMYARVVDKVASGSALQKRLFGWAAETGRKFVAAKIAGSATATLRCRQSIAHALVFRKLQKATGGHLRFFISGSAPLAREIAEFFHAAGLPILEGYGLTETSPVLTVNTFDHLRLGTVGRPLPGVELRIADDGEILARGEAIMQGYYKKPEATAEALADGWFHTGDIGRLDEDGFLMITDRKKDLMITAGGKNVAPQPIENSLKQCPHITEAVLIGDRRPYISALIVPAFEKLEAFARGRGLPFHSRSDLVAFPEVRALVQGEIDAVNRDLARFEQPHKFTLLDRDLTIEAGELTPSLKVRRRIVLEKFKDLVDAMYAS